MMNFYGFYPMMWGGGWGWLFILFWILIIWLIVSFFSHSARRHSEDDDNQTSNLKIIKKRYAKGEITKKEYEELKKEFSHYDDEE
jgi:putative membrane protein